MAQSTVFPAFIRAEYDSNSPGFRDFEQAAISAAGRAQRQFEKCFDEIGGQLQRALARGVGQNGKLDFDTAGLRRAAEDAERMALVSRDLARAADQAARSTGDTTESTRLYVQAARAAAIGAEQEARELNAKALTYERLEAEINKANLATSRAAAFASSGASANRMLAGSQRQLQMASVQAGQQLQDIVISLGSGQRAGTVFAQQLPQLAFALSDVGGRVGAVARVLAGPWGVALAGASFVLGGFVEKLFGASDASKAAEFASYSLGDAQSVLGNVIDLTTGKINNQNAALQGLAQAQLLVARVQAQGRLAEARRGVTAIQDRSLVLDGGFGGGINIRRRQRDGRDVISQQVLSGDITTKKAVEQLEQLRRIGRLTDDEFTAAATSVANLGLELENLKVFESANRLLNGQANAADRSLLLKPKTTRGGRKSTGASEKRAAEQLQRDIDGAAESVQRLREQFDDAPRDIDRANKAARELDGTLKDVQERLAGKNLTQDQRAKLEQTERDIKDAQRRILPNFRQRPVTDRIEDMDKELQLQRLILGGREDEADLLGFQQDLMRQLRVQTVEQLEAELRGRNISKEKLDLMYAQFRQLRENARVQQRMDRSVRSVSSQLQELDRARSTLEQSIAALPNDARGALKDFAQNIRQQVNDIIARRLADNLFGDLFTRLEGQIRGKRPIDAATEGYVASTTRASTALIDLTNTFIYASGAMRGAANDNIVSIAKGSNVAAQALKAASKSLTTSYDPDAEIVVRAGGGKTNNREQRQINEAMEKSAKSLADLARSAAEGMFIGQTAGSLLFGNKNSATGSAIGGALGKIAGDAIGKTLGGSLGKFAGPLGSIAGGLLGGALGKVFMGTKRGSATIGGSGDVLSVASFGGNSKKFQQAAGTGADSAISTINRIAEMLGADVNAAAGSVSIGIRDGKYRVDTTGRGITKTKKGAIDFGDDAEAAIRAATLDLIRDGVLTGLRASTQRILQTGKDLDAAIQKALDFESVFTRLKEYKDPVGAAIDTLDKEFVRLRKVFQEAGASAQEYAELEELYGIERAKAIKEASERVTSSLKSLYDQLTIGDSGRSLRDRLGAAQAAYDPLRARVMAGDRTAYDDFAKAAQELLEIQRQFSGSQTPYFNLLDEITRLTKERIDAEANITSIAENRDTPFTSSGAAAQNYAPVVGAIDRQTEVLTAGFRALLAANDTGDFGGGGFRLPSFM